MMAGRPRKPSRPRALRSARSRPADAASLKRRLDQAEATIAALLADKVDAVLDPASTSAVMLRSAQEGLRELNERLERSEAHFRSLIENVTDLITVLEADGTTRYISPSVRRLLGFDPSELIGHSAFDLVHPDDAPGVQAFMADAVACGVSAATVSYRHQHRDGSWRQFESTGVNLLADDPVRGIVVTSRDVTERLESEARYRSLFENMTELRLAEESLRRSEEDFRAMAEAMPQIVWAARPDGWNIFFNQQWVDYTGLTMEESYGHGWNKPFHPDDQQRAWDAWQRATQNNERYSLECRLRRADGVYRWWLIRGAQMRGANGEVLKWFGTCTDIEEFKQAQEALRRSEEQLAVTLNSIGDGVLATDSQGRVTRLNPAAEELTGWTQTEALGRPAAEVFHIIDEDRREPVSIPVEKVLATGAVQSVASHSVLIARDGRERPIADSAAPIRDEDGLIRGAVLVFRDVTEEKNSEKAIRKLNDELEQRVRERTAEWEGQRRHNELLLNCAGEGIYGLDLEGRVTFINPAGAGILGYTVAELLRQPMHAKCHHTYGDGRPFPREECPICAAFRDGHAHHEIDGVMWRKDGSAVAVEHTSTSIRDEEGQISGAIVVFRDITERKRVAEALQASERLLRESQAVAKLGSYVLDFSTGRWTSSAILDDIFGIDERYDRTVEGWLQIVDPDWRDRMARYFTEEVIGKRRPFDIEYPIRPERDGDTRWVHGLGRLEFDAEGKPLRMVGTISDVSERRQVETLLRLQVAALDAAADGIAITDRTGAFEWVNPAFTLLTGYTAEEALGKNPRDLIKSGKHPQAFFKELWDTILAGGTWRGDVSNRRKDGSLYTERQTITPILDATGAITHFVAIKKDITERLQLEAQFRQAQKMEGVGQLASGIAHDFNNLLTVINGMADLVLAQVSHDDPVHADVEEIQRAGERGATLTRQLLAFSRQQILEPRVLNVNTVVAGMESLLRRLLGEDVDLVVIPAPDLRSVRADPGQLEQVLTNLAVNARDAMPQGGRLTIETTNVTVNEDDAPQRSEHMPPGSYVRLVVSDSGIGMDEATRTRVFEPFFTTKGPSKGTGLGLSTVYGIVKQSQGFIGVYSEVGHGTSFTIYLPQETGAVVAPRSAPTMALSVGTETILLVEDNAGLRRLATRILEPAGYIVLGAATAEEALGLLERQTEPVHLLLTDVVLPGMSGRLLAEQLAQTRPATKVLYMSGYTSDTIVRHGVLETNMSFLNKPFTAAALLGKVRELLNS